MKFAFQSFISYYGEERGLSRLHTHVSYPPSYKMKYRLTIQKQNLIKLNSPANSSKRKLHMANKTENSFTCVTLWLSIYSVEY
jgi:hypothetical protein